MGGGGAGLPLATVGATGFAAAAGFAAVQRVLGGRRGKAKARKLTAVEKALGVSNAELDAKVREPGPVAGKRQVPGPGPGA